MTHYTANWHVNGHVTPIMELTSSRVEEFVTNGYITIYPSLDQDIHSRIFQQSSAYFVEEDTLGNNIFPEIEELDLIFNSTEVTSSLECLLGPNYLMHTHRRCHDSHPGRSTQSLHKDTYKVSTYSNYFLLIFRGITTMHVIESTG
jgi:hypothetical protein